MRQAGHAKPGKLPKEQRMRLERVRLRRLWNVAEQFLLAAAAQNLKRLLKFLAHRQAVVAPSTA
jgi:hypothetical protein